MKKLLPSMTAAVLAGALLLVPLPASGLEHNEHTRSPLPIPASDQTLVTEQAKSFFTVTRDNHILESAVLDYDGNVYFCDVTGASILRLTPQMKLETVLAMQDGFAPNGLAFHADGRLFVCANDYRRGLGIIFSLDLKTMERKEILPPAAGFFPNDLVFDKAGGFYFTDFKGSSTQPLGGAWYMSPDLAKVTPVIPNLCKANGVALSPDGTILYVTEFARNTLHMAFLADATTPLPTGTFAAYHFTGPGPDSMRVDSEGNLYVAMARQGKVLVFNKYCLPIGQVLLPGRNEERAIRTTCVGIMPGDRKMLVLTGSDNKNRVEGSHIFEATAFAPGLPMPFPRETPR